MTKSGDKLVPLKQVLDQVDASRTTLWRALNSGIDGFPNPVKKGGKIFWKKTEIARLKAALGAYRGRGQFAVARGQARARAQLERQLKTQAPRKRKRAAEPSQPTLCDGLIQHELFPSTK